MQMGERERIFDNQNRCIAILENSTPNEKSIFKPDGSRLGVFLVTQNITTDRNGNRIGYGDQRMRLVG
jgi:hypothetical protein